MPDRLKLKTLHALFWSFLERFAQQGIQFIISIILARLLLPEQFGLIAMLMIFMAIAQSFIDSGFGYALIQKQDTTHIDECSIFYFNILVGFIAVVRREKMATDFKMTKGRDHEIVRQLKKVLDERGKTKKVFTLEGIYGCAQTKAIIRQFDMLVSGRIHGAFYGLSQMVHTVIIDYGHQPKAHKLQGFSEVAEMSEYVADPTNSADVIQKVQQCWSKRVSIREHLRKRIPEVQELARENFNLFPGVLHKKTSTVNGIGSR